MNEHELLVLHMLARCRFPPGVFAKRFVRSVTEQKLKVEGPIAPLSPKQRKCLWEIAWKFRRQLVTLGVAQSCIDAHKAGYHEWENVSLPEQAFERLLCDDPDDWQTRLIYADWREDRGEAALAMAQRWMAEVKVRPSLRFYGLLRRWQWWISSSSGGQAPLFNPAGRIFEVAESSRIAAERTVAKLCEAT